MAITPRRLRIAALLQATLIALRDLGGDAKFAQIRERLLATFQFTSHELAILEKSGNPRWFAEVQFYSIDLAKAGWISKENGRWHLSEEGVKAISLEPAEFYQIMTDSYKAWKLGRQPTVPTEDDEDEIAIDTQATYEELNQKAGDQIRDHLAVLNGYEFQELCAELLRAMGYYIAHVAPKGPDGGIDIVAYTDPIGARGMRILVQVKHKPGTTSDVNEIKQFFASIKKQEDVGLFVSTGGFTSVARTFARESDKHIDLMDLDKFMGLWQEHYRQISEKGHQMLPLKPIFLLAPPKS